MGAADAGAPGCGAHDCHPAECRMGGASSGQARGGRLGIAGLARGRLSFGRGLSGLGRTSARGTCSTADLGRAAPAAASRGGPDLGLTSACLSARVRAGAFVGRAACTAARVTTSRGARSIMGSSFGSSAILGGAARTGSGGSSGPVGSVVEPARRSGLGRTRASRGGGAGPCGRRVGRGTRGPVLGGAARSRASSAAHRRTILGSRASLAFFSAACALVGPALCVARMGASAD